MQLGKHSEVGICSECYTLKGGCNCKKRYVYIDAGIVYIIQTLNLKGYKTIGSCEGHEEHIPFDGYIAFKEKYDFNIPIPKYCILKENKYRDSYWLIVNENVSKEKFLSDLLEWSLSLERNNKI